MIEVERDLWKASVLIPLLRWGHFNPFAQDHVQMTFYYLQRGRLHKLSVHDLLFMLHQPQNEQVFPTVPIVSCVISESFQSLSHLWGPLQGCLQDVHDSPVVRCPQLDPVLRVWPHQGWVKEKLTFLDLLAALLVMLEPSMYCLPPLLQGHITG